MPGLSWKVCADFVFHLPLEMFLPANVAITKMCAEARKPSGKTANYLFFLVRWQRDVGDCSSGGPVLLPGCGLHLPRCPLQTQREEEENGLFSGSAEQHLFSLDT